MEKDSLSFVFFRSRVVNTRTNVDKIPVVRYAIYDYTVDVYAHEIQNDPTYDIYCAYHVHENIRYPNCTFREFLTNISFGSTRFGNVCNSKLRLKLQVRKFGSRRTFNRVFIDDALSFEFLYTTLF